MTLVVTPELMTRFRAAALAETGKLRRRFGDGSAPTVLRRLVSEYVAVHEAAARQREQDKLDAQEPIAEPSPSRGARR